MTTHHIGRDLHLRVWLVGARLAVQQHEAEQRVARAAIRVRG